MSNSTSAVPASLGHQLQARQTLLGLSDQDLCAAIGFERTIVLTLVKAGTLKMPLTKILALAAVLELDAVDLLKTVLHESAPDLLQIITDVLNPLHLSATEVNLIRHLRELRGDRQGASIVMDATGVFALVVA